MKLYYAPGACSLASHIALCQAGLKAELVKVDLGSKKTADGSDYWAINPNGYVPALQLDDGVVLSEGPAILQYIADQAPGSQLAAANGTLARYQQQALLNFIGTELHKNCSTFFNPRSSADAKDNAKAQLARRLNHVASLLDKSPYLSGDTLGIADCYLYVVLSWFSLLHIELTPWPRLVQFLERMSQHPAVQAARRAEGLQ